MTLNQLIRMAADRLMIAIYNRWINHKIHAEYRHLDHFKKQVKEGNVGIADCSKRIVNLENQKI